MARRAAEQKKEEVLDPRVIEALDRFRENLKIASKRYSRSELARKADLDDETLRLIEKNERTPGLATFIALALATRTSPDDWFAHPSAFLAVLPQEKRDLSFLEPQSPNTDSFLSFGDSGAASASKEHWETRQANRPKTSKKQRGSGRTGTEGASSRCPVQIDAPRIASVSYLPTKVTEAHGKRTSLSTWDVPRRVIETFGEREVA